MNCAFFGCGTNRNNVSGTYDGISLFKITSRKGQYWENWRKEVVNILTKSRVVDASLRNQIDCNTVYICERHYKPEDIEISRKFGHEHLGNFVIKPQAKLYR